MSSRMPPAVRWVLAIALVVISAYVMWRIRVILGALAASFILAYAIEPAVHRLERWRVPRPLGAALIAMLAVSAVVITFVVAVPVLIAQVSAFSKSVHLEGLADPTAWPPSVREYIAAHHDDIEGYKAAAITWAKGNAGRLFESIGAMLAGIFTSVASLIVALLNVIVVPVFAYYLVVDYHAIKRGTAELVPESSRPEVFRIAGEIDGVMRAFLRGQGMLALSMGVMYAIGLTILGTPLGILVGLAAGLLNMVPYLGLACGMVPAVLLSFLEYQSWSRVLGVVAVFVITQNIEGWILTPRLLGNAVGLHPVVVVLAVMIGGELFGFAGILIAVPAAAVLSVFVREGLSRYRRSRLFRTGWDVAPIEPDAH